MMKKPLLSALLIASISACSVTPPASKMTSTGYPTTQAALEGLHKRKDVKFSTHNGWTIAEENGSQTVWSFPPKGHPAYPAAVKRQFLQENGKFELKMGMNCEAPQAACDQLATSFSVTNDQLVQRLNTAR